MNNIQQCVLAIWYTTNGVKHHHAQGKIFQNGGQWYFLVNVDKEKFIRKYHGYAVAQRILEAFEFRRLKRVVIVFRDKEKKISYITNSSYMKDKGVYDNLRSHRQVTLPVKLCSPMQGLYGGDPKGLPIVDVEDWSKGIQEVYEYVGNVVRIKRIEPGVQQTLAI